MYTGIVLKNYLPGTCKLAVLDQEWGRIQAIVYRRTIIERIAHGAILTYVPVQRQSSLFVLEEIEIINSPLEWALYDLFFFHFILEVIYFFAPLHAPVPHLFAFIMQLYTMTNITEKEKRVVICQLFALLGVYPENAVAVFPALFLLISSSSNIMLNKSLDAVSLHELNSWVKQCIAAHPYAQSFKTNFSAQYANDT